MASISLVKVGESGMLMRERERGDGEEIGERGGRRRRGRSGLREKESEFLFLLCFILFLFNLFSFCYIIRVLR